MSKKIDDTTNAGVKAIRENEAMRSFAETWLAIQGEHNDKPQPSLDALVNMLANFLKPVMEYFEPETCGTRHIIAERALRIIQQQGPLDGPITADAIEAIDHLCSEAGPYFARQYLKRNDAPADLDLPF